MAKVKEKEAHEYTLGEYLKALREKKRASLKDVERDTGIPNAYISQLETGARKKLPDPDRMRKLADYYNITVRELLQQAGYYEPKDVPQTYEQRIEKFFLHAINDPEFNSGSRINPKELNLDAKRFIVEIYSHFNAREGRKIMKKKLEESKNAK